VVYLPEGGSATVDLSAGDDALHVAWFGPTTGETVAARTVQGGGSREFAAPFAGDAVLHPVAR
jgi:hypothetical protein